MIEKTSWFQLQPLYRYLRQQSENEKFRKYLEISATFLLITIFLFTAITPTASAISKLIGEINSKKLTSKNMTNKIKGILLAQENFSLVQEKYQILESNFPQKPNFYKSGSAFSAISKQVNIPLNQLAFDLSTKDKNDSDKSNSFAVSFSVDGQYSSVLEMINKVINNRRLSEIQSISIVKTEDKNKTKNKTNDGSITLSISTKLFYLPSSNEEK